ncbi:GntR family transcriptional regulator [Fictibacillus phosphorivorans]|uniref:GntR family transcriptional regulator n=1 Tax=Fictibacillus phosphorivorans TaxID=1221500 RepID=UPI00203B95B3|nr:GntR family transcriptional regulator [Fictibacillus phosphorivorans]MCM3720054.1 GntR family transcriptional regulator [Fictibacillus phosphorivorans]MCM3777747.1 GntR family transcriptional regulator [Fictibacillus phosphorivorans]
MNTPLYETIYDHIINQINQGLLKQGDRVPSEKDLAEEFNVSRITSKKALDLLAQNKIITRLRGKGSFVSEDQADKLEIRAPKSKLTDIKLIGFIIPDFDDAFGSNLIKTIEEKCLENNCHLIIRRTGGQIKEEERAIKNLVQFGVDGLIIFPVQGEHYNAELLKLVLTDFPLVLVDRYLKGIPASSVCTDNRSASEKITNYLFSMGHEDIAFLSPPPTGTSTIEERVQGFNQAYSKKGIKLNPKFQLSLNNSLPPERDKENSSILMGPDYQAIKDFIQENPTITAFIVCEYGLALLLNKVINDLGKRVPEDYSLVCFDYPENYFDQPAFTHLRQHEQEMGSKAVELLMMHFKGEKIPELTKLDYSLVEGLSTKVKIKSKI